MEAPFKVIKAKHYYNWGNEPTGYVSTGYYNRNDVWVECKQMLKTEAEQIGLTFKCPYQ